MGTLVDNKIQELARILERIRTEIRIARWIESATQHLDVDVSWYMYEKMILCFFHSRYGDFVRLRRALGIEHMTKTFDSASGKFVYRASINVGGIDVDIRFLGVAPSCRVVPRTATKEVTEYEAVCEEERV